jgi:predicted nucleotide-binding protein (sugar kinase/HSP70/actin superfamily)
MRIVLDDSDRQVDGLHIIADLCDFMSFALYETRNDLSEITQEQARGFNQLLGAVADLARELPNYS